tara:strand:+ start:3073 stop:4065 length:993 start_codon:yes stop_codon:yes gene_type:complete
MILKNFEINKININKNNFILFYGKNEGFKKEAINIILKNQANPSKYQEKEILENYDAFLDSVRSRSLFEDKKIVVISSVSDKIFNTIDELFDLEIEDLIIILNADNLDKKSKLRSFFEKNSSCITVAFYPDNNQVLFKLASDFLRNKKISLSPSIINSIISKCTGERNMLYNELEKISNFCSNKKKITQEEVSKLTNLFENYSISELVDNCLAKNQKKTINILNENNFTNEDCILITRTFLNKSKRILKLSSEYKKNKNIDLTILKAKPPIFWKDKEITKQQISKWTPENINKLIYKINNIELILKKNFTNSLNLLSDFILEESSSSINS